MEQVAFWDDWLTLGLVIQDFEEAIAVYPDLSNVRYQIYLYAIYIVSSVDWAFMHIAREQSSLIFMWPSCLLTGFLYFWVIHTTMQIDRLREITCERSCCQLKILLQPFYAKVVALKSELLVVCDGSLVQVFFFSDILAWVYIIMLYLTPSIPLLKEKKEKRWKNDCLFDWSCIWNIYHIVEVQDANKIFIWSNVNITISDKKEKKPKIRIQIWRDFRDGPSSCPWSFYCSTCKNSFFTLRVYSFVKNRTKYHWYFSMFMQVQRSSQVSFFHFYLSGVSFADSISSYS